jgi:glutathione-specific gamma-glutamylcyclotransferase
LDQDNTAWVFGYGSLIYKVDFPYLDAQPAQISGWARRFWQGSHDHRGTPGAPGRVVTLLPSEGTICKGIAYRVDKDVFDHLDFREKNGYQRQQLSIQLTNKQSSVSGVVYVAATDNHAFLGPASSEAIATQIAASSGPSGKNSDYLLKLATALRDLGEHDAHVFDLEKHVLALG